MSLGLKGSIQGTVYHANFHSVVFNFDHCYVLKSKEKHCFNHTLPVETFQHRL